jgi:hypothetical protein
MDVRVIPIESRRLVFRIAKTILKRRIARLDQSLQDIVLMANRRHRQTMKVKIGRRRDHRAARAWVGILFGNGVRVMMVHCGCGAARIRQIVLQIQDEKIARM